MEEKFIFFSAADPTLKKSVINKPEFKKACFCVYRDKSNKDIVYTIYL